MGVGKAWARGLRVSPLAFQACSGTPRNLHRGAWDWIGQAAATAGGGGRGGRGDHAAAEGCIGSSRPYEPRQGAVSGPADLPPLTALTSEPLPSRNFIHVADFARKEPLVQQTLMKPFVSRCHSPFLGVRVHSRPRMRPATALKHSHIQRTRTPFLGQERIC